MKKCYLLIIALLFGANVIKAQLPSGSYSDYFREGIFLIGEENYDVALKNFLEAYKIDSTSANLNFNIGYCYLNSSMNKGLAESHLAKAVQKITKNYKNDDPSEKEAPPIAYFYYGKALHFNYKFDEAMAQYDFFEKNYVKDKTTREDVEFYKAQTVYAKELVAAPINVNNTGGEKTQDGQYYEDIVISYKDENDKWSSPKSISPNINTVGHEASVNLTPDGQTLIVFKGVSEKDGNIFFSNWDGKDWSSLQSFGSDINSKYWESHACLTADNNTLYFVSDRPGGYGGRDIYRCVRLPNGAWSKALNV
ncbi:MAG: PD40 domain-containing protein, partial [Bacteroidetes bacterium]|nr:PD40 domain-containing protein [Bacteroidota bacterium]